MALSEKTIKNFYRLLTLISIVGGVIYASFLFLDIIILLVISIFIAMIFNPLVTLLENHGVKRLVSVLLVFINLYTHVRGGQRQW